jgi:hypothetical protein
MKESWGPETCKIRILFDQSIKVKSSITNQLPSKSKTNAIQRVTKPKRIYLWNKHARGSGLTRAGGRRAI